MVDPKKEAARRGAEAMFEAGKDAARKLYDDVTLTDEEKKRREAARLLARKRKRQKWIAIAIAAVVALFVVMALVASYWPYILGLALLGGLGWLGYRRVRGALGKKADGGDSAGDEEAPTSERTRAAEKPTRKLKRPARLDPEDEEEAPAPRAKVRIEEPAEDPAVVAARVAAKNAERDRQIEDELAELKRKAKE